MSAPLLRPLGFGEILDGGFTLYRRHFSVLFATALLAMLPMAVASGAWVQVVMGFSPDDSNLTGLLGGALLMMGAGLISWSVVLGAIVSQVAGAVSGGEVSVADGCRQAFRRFVPIATAFVLSVLLIMAGMFAVMVPMAILFGIIIAVTAVMSGGAPAPTLPIIGVALVMVTMLVAIFMLMASLFAVTPAVVLESRGPVAALARSWQLSRGARLRIVGVLFVSWVIIMLPAIAISMLTGDAAGLFNPEAAATISTGQLAMQQVLSLLSSALTMPFFVACSTLLYFDRRVRTEAYDLELAVEGLPARS